MIGYIVNYDAETQTGRIESGNFKFEFHLDDWVALAEPEAGDEVKFNPQKNIATNIDLVGAAFTQADAVKYKNLAVVLAIFLGGIGAHRIYLGFYKIGLVQIGVTMLTMGYGVVWGVVEAVLLLGNHIHRDAKGRPLK
ncbi:MAG: TM2 domain-containing protein [Methylococcaceae bacterium]|jgi:hypothetical protein